jgi:hypothetical protein
MGCTGTIAPVGILIITTGCFASVIREVGVYFAGEDRTENDAGNIH